MFSLLFCSNSHCLIREFLRFILISSKALQSFVNSLFSLYSILKSKSLFLIFSDASNNIFTGVFISLLNFLAYIKVNTIINIKGKNIIELDNKNNAVLWVF